MPQQIKYGINIGPRESRKRLAMGMVMLVAGIGIAIVLIFTGLNHWWRIGLLFPFLLGALGFFQAMAKT